jgi:ABC-type sugar transport system ATPase subunit
MRVRRTTLALLLVGLFLLLAGCGSGGGASGNGSEGGVSLTIWADDKYSRAIKDSAARWGPENDVKVNVQAVSKDARLVRDAPADTRLRATVSQVEALGARIVVHFEIDAPKVVTEDTKALEKDAHAEDVPTHVQGTKFVAAFAPRSRVRIGDEVEVVVDTERMHFFDPDTGNAIRA